MKRDDYISAVIFGRYKKNYYLCTQKRAKMLMQVRTLTMIHT